MKDSYQKIIAELLDLQKNDVENEKGFEIETQKQIILRDEKYSQLLDHFVNITRKRNESKEKYKWIFFKIIMTLLIGVGCISIFTVTVILLKGNTEQIIRSVPALITAIAGFISAIIAIPLSITKYLFSTAEDEYITRIISHTQEHDLSSRRLLKKIEQVMLEEEIKEEKTS